MNFSLDGKAEYLAQAFSDKGYTIRCQWKEGERGVQYSIETEGPLFRATGTYDGYNITLVATDDNGQECGVHFHMYELGDVLREMS